MKSQSSPGPADKSEDRKNKNLEKLESLLQKTAEKEDEEDLDFSPRVTAKISRSALVGNFDAIQAQVPSQFLLPMIKANAYGHGAIWAAEKLAGRAGLFGFGLATLEEGAEIRQALGPKNRQVRLLIFSGTVGWTKQKGNFCEKYGLTPVISADEDWQLFLNGGWTARLSYHLKFNTGMNRLGMSPELAGLVAQKLRQKETTEHPEGILSHLAMGESPDAKLSQVQLAAFRNLKRELSPAFPAALFHLANSSAIWQQKSWGLEGLTEIVRPGISLYGVSPWVGAPARGLSAVMSLSARVVSIRKLKSGDQVGYGGTFTVPTGFTKRDPYFSAVLACGYADGVSRRLSNQGEVFLNGKRQRFIGIVSMDLSAISCDAQTRVGDWAEILGVNLDPWVQAKAASTLPYELLTSVSGRVQREYVD